MSLLVRRLRDQPVCLLVTWRSKRVSNDPRLSQLKNEALRAGKATVISLSRLSLSDVRELVEAIAPALSRDLVERLYQETEGLPFFLVEYLKEITSGVLAAQSVGWSPPGGVCELIA